VQEMSKDVRKKWKDALLFLLEERWFTIEYVIGTAKSKEKQGEGAGAVTLSDNCAFTKLFKSYDSIEAAEASGKADNEIALRYHIYSSAALIIEELDRMGMLKAEKTIGSQSSTIKINEKGFEAALKLQEHEDNHERFEQQSGISKVLQSNSSKSVLTARLALALSVVLVSFGGYRIYQLEQKIMSHSNMEQRIHSAEEESDRLDKEVVRLKGELSGLISVDNDKGKPVAVIVDSNKSAT
jgi:cell division protein FtsL